MIKKQKKIRYRGTATIEAAIMLPLLLLLTLGVIEYGWMFLKAQQTTNAARHAARIAIRPDSSNTDVINVIDQIMTSAEMGSSGYSVTYFSIISFSSTLFILGGSMLEFKRFRRSLNHKHS